MRAAIPLEPSRLSGLRWTFPDHFGFARGLSMVPLISSEILRAAHDFPIGLCLVGQNWRLVALLGDVPTARGKLIDDDGRWMRAYVPFWIRVHPFVVRDHAVELELDPRCVGSTGRSAFVDEGGHLTRDVLNIERQLKMAAASAEALTVAANLLAAEIAEPWPSADGLDLRMIRQEGLERHIAPRSAEWLARSPRAVELAITLAFSIADAPRSRPVRVTRAGPIPAAANALSKTEFALQTNSAPADLDWLDLDEKVAF